MESRQQCIFRNFRAMLELIYKLSHVNFMIFECFRAFEYGILKAESCSYFVFFGEKQRSISFLLIVESISTTVGTVKFTYTVYTVHII